MRKFKRPKNPSLKRFRPIVVRFGVFDYYYYINKSTYICQLELEKKVTIMSFAENKSRPGKAAIGTI